MTSPRTTHLSLSSNRVDQFISEAQRGFENNSIGRDILRFSNLRSNAGFSKIGVDHIVDRIWFVDGDFVEGYGNLGGVEYGSSVAEGELELVLNRLIQEPASQQIVEIHSNEIENGAIRALSLLRERGAEPTMILTNIDQQYEFWDSSRFQPSEPQSGFRRPFGRFDGVEVLYSRLLPSGLVFVFDKEHTGSLEIKSEFTASVNDIRHPTQIQRVRHSIPSLSEQAIREKVEILCYEIVKPTVHLDREDNGFQIIHTIGTEMRIGGTRSI